MKYFPHFLAAGLFFACGSKNTSSRNGGDGDGDSRGDGDVSGDGGGEGDGDAKGDGDVGGDGNGDDDDCAELSDCCPLFEPGLERDACEGAALTGNDAGCGVLLATHSSVCNDDSDPNLNLPPADVVGTWSDAKLIPGTGETTLTQQGNTILISSPDLSAFDVCADEAAVVIETDLSLYTVHYDFAEAAWGDVYEVDENNGLHPRIPSLSYNSTSCSAVLTWSDRLDVIGGDDRYDLTAAYYDPDSGWRPSEVLEEGGDAIDHFAGVGSDGAGEFIYRLGAPGYEVGHRPFTIAAGSGSFSTLTGDNVEYYDDVAMLPGGEMLVAYNENNDQMVAQAITRHRSGSGVWAEPVIHEGEPFRTLSVISAVDRFQVVYEARDGLTSGLGGAGGSGGADWGDLELVTVSAEGVFGARVGIPAAIPPWATFFSQGEAVFAVWEEDLENGDAILASHYAPSEGWSGVQSISAEIHDNPYTFEFAADREGNALLVYDIEGALVFANQYVAGVGWGGVHHVTSGDEPHLSMTPDGSAFLIVRRFSGFDRRYYSMILK